MDKRISMEKLLYVFGYDINWWKNDGKLLIFLMCLQKEKEKEKKRYKVTLWKKKKWKVEKKCKPKKYMN